MILSPHFAMAMECELPSEENWHFVNNPNGGFWNALLSWTTLGKYPTYLQLEERKLCDKNREHKFEVIPTYD